jgi:hypothetical protein
MVLGEQMALAVASGGMQYLLISDLKNILNT